jgi:hypothetical protein
VAGISDSTVIDLVTYDPSRDEIAVIMVADQPWSDASELLDQIVAKLNIYIRFIQDGSLTRSFADAVGKAVRIQVDCNRPPSGEAARIFSEAQEALRIRGIGIAVNVIAPAS